MPQFVNETPSLPEYYPYIDIRSLMQNNPLIKQWKTLHQQTGKSDHSEEAGLFPEEARSSLSQEEFYKKIQVGVGFESKGSIYSIKNIKDKRFG